MEDARSTDPKLADIWASLDRVMDPELDEPITDMGFVEAVSVHEGTDVMVSFRLPTYWCSPNFAFLMAEGIKREVDALPWVRDTMVQLEDHMAAEEMNAVVNAGGSFADAFEELREGEDLDALREKFDCKAYQRRQEVAIKAQIAVGHSVAGVLTMKLGTLQRATFSDAQDARQTSRYLDLLQRRKLAVSSDDPAFPTWEGKPITELDFENYMGLLRSVRINMEFSGSLCHGLKLSRYKEVDLSGDAPTLVDFIMKARAEAHDERPSPRR